jgi:hypothetical protein
MGYVTCMPRSDSGRVVIDLDPEFKKELYSALREDDSNLKNWFIEKARHYVEDKKQPSLFGTGSVKEESVNYRFSKSPKSNKGGCET